MQAIVTKANSNYWYKIKSFNTMEDIQKFIQQCKCGIIIEKNRYIRDRSFDFWKGMKIEDIPVIKNCPLHITI